MPHLSVMLTPLHIHNVRTPDEYRRAQLETLMSLKRSHPSLFAGISVFLSLAKPTVFVSGGKWVVRCLCGNAPSVDPEWRMALCFECGAQYEGLDIPEEHREIAALLLRRPNVSNRHWSPPETVADLEAENRAHGVD